MKKFNKKFVYGTGSATLIAGVCIVILLLNLIAGLLSDKFGLKLDATETGLSFSSEFNEYIKSVDKEIDVYYMCNPNEMIRISGKNDITETTGQVDNSNYRIRIKYMFFKSLSQTKKKSTPKYILRFLILIQIRIKLNDLVLLILMI